MAKNRICNLCGEKYSYCPTCSADLGKPSWYAMWHSEACMKLDDILVRHTLNKISDEDAKNTILEEGLNTLNISDKDNRKHYNKIMGIVEIIEEVEEKPVLSENNVEVDDVAPIKDINDEKKVEDKIDVNVDNKIDEVKESVDKKPAYNGFKKKK